MSLDMMDTMRMMQKIQIFGVGLSCPVFSEKRNMYLEPMLIMSEVSPSGCDYLPSLSAALSLALYHGQSLLSSYLVWCRQSHSNLHHPYTTHSLLNLCWILFLPDYLSRSGVQHPCMKTLCEWGMWVWGVKRHHCLKQATEAEAHTVRMDMHAGPRAGLGWLLLCPALSLWCSLHWS